MKKTTFRQSLILLLLAMLPSLAQALDAGVSCAVYATPDNKPYIEINLEIAAASINYRRSDTLMQASVDVLVLLKNGETVVNYEKYTLKSPLVGSPQSLLDVRRLAVPNGTYTLEITFQDLNDPDNHRTFSTTINVAVNKDALYLSDLQVYRSFQKDAGTGSLFAKNGYIMEPLPFCFYEQGANKLAFYAEIYHSDRAVAANETYLIRYFIEKDMGNGQQKMISAGSQRKKPSAVDVLLVQMDIAQLESGNYRLKVEVRNTANEVVAERQLYFQRSNPLLNADVSTLSEEELSKQFVQTLDEAALRYALRAIVPIQMGVYQETLRGVQKKGDLKEMRFFLFRHFATTNPNDPEKAYRDYLLLASAVDKKFYTAYGYGFETDRGRIFLKYGRPDDLIHVEDDPSAPPYEIWVYLALPRTNQRNVKFLFYNPTLAGEDFVLLHSSARGEINNPRWERVLYQRNAGEQFDGDNSVDATKMKRNINRNARVYFEDF